MGTGSYRRADEKHSHGNPACTVALGLCCRKPRRSFHSPVESARTVANGISIIQDTRILLARLLAHLGHNEPVPYPDISTKAKAQEFIGLNMKSLREEKQEFKKTVLPKWAEEAEKRGCMECFTDKLIDFKTEIVNKKLFYPAGRDTFFCRMCMVSFH